MSFHPTVYPDSLPAPSVAPLTAAERRALAASGGPFDARALERDVRGTQQITWPVLSAAEDAILYAWWRDTLIFGGSWFSARWPLPSGMRGGVRRFIGTLKRQLVPGGSWRVSAVCELRGRGLPPGENFVELWLSSVIYPALVIDSYSAAPLAPKGIFQWPPIERYSLSGSVISGVLTTILRSYTYWPPENYALSSAVIAGVIHDVLRSYTYWPPEKYSLSAAAVSGVLATGLDRYSMLPESFSLSAAVVSGVIT